MHQPRTLLELQRRGQSRAAGHVPGRTSDCVKMLWALHSPAISAARAFLPLHFGRQMTRKTSFAWSNCPTVSTFHTVCRSSRPLRARDRSHFGSLCDALAAAERQGVGQRAINAIPHERSDRTHVRTSFANVPKPCIMEQV